MTGLVAKIGLGAALAPAQAFFKSVPRQVWIGLAIAVAAFTGFLIHQHYAHKAIAAAEKRGADAAYANVAAQAQQLADKANALNRNLAAVIRNRTDEETRSNARAANDLRVSGPGKAACAAVARPAAATGRPQQAASSTGVAVDQVPNGAGPDLIAMPFAGAVGGAQEHDDLLAEVKGWHSWYSTFSDQWAKWQAESAKARAKP